MPASIPYFDDPNKWVPLPQYQLSPSGQPLQGAGMPLGSVGPLGTPLRNGPGGAPINPQNAPAQQGGGMNLLPVGQPTPWGGSGGQEMSPPSFNTSDAMGPPGGGGLPFGMTGRDILGAISKAGFVFPNPVSMAAGAANGVMSWGNMNNLDATRGAYSFPELTAGQRAGGVLGLNGYGTSSTANDFNAQMAQAIAQGQQVTVPNVFGPTSAGGLNPGEVADAPSMGTPGDGGWSGFDGVDTGSLSDMGYSGGFGIGW